MSRWIGLLALSGCAGINPEFDVMNADADSTVETADGGNSDGGEGTSGDGTSGDGDGTSGDGDGTSGDGTSGDGDGTSGDGDGTSGDGDGTSGDGDGTSGDGDGTSGDGDGTSGDGDGTSGDGDGTSGDGDGTSGDGDGTSGDGDGDGTSAPPFQCDDTDASLVACYSFDAIDAGLIRDGSSYGNDMVVGSGTLAPGLEGLAAAAASGTSFSIPTSPSLEFTDQLTIEWWFRTDGTLTSDKISVFSDSSTCAVELRPAGFRCAFAGEQVAGISLPVGTWVHLACAKGPVATTLYVNGVPSGSAPNGGPLGIAADITVAQSASPTPGWIDSMRIYAAERSAAEICAAAGGVGC